MPRPTVSVIVPAAPGQLEAALAAVAGLELAEGDQVLVATNMPRRGALREDAPTLGSSYARYTTHDSTRADRARPVSAPVRVINAAGPASSYFARARAAAEAAGEWLVFIDADCEPAADLLDAYFDPPPADRTAVLAGSIEDVAVRSTLVARYVTMRRKLDQATTLAHPRAPYAQTANCAVRRSAFESVGGFPDPVRSGGDADLCWRLDAAGWTLEQRPRARVRHRSRETLRALLAQLHRHGAGMQWLNARWPGAFALPNPRRVAARAASLVSAAPAFAALDCAGACARELGRLRANGDPTWHAPGP